MFSLKTAQTIAGTMLSICLLCACTKKNEAPYQYKGDTAMWNHTFAVSEPFLMPKKMPAGIIIPHHDICTFEQNSFYRALSQYGCPSVVVLLSPDHFERGEKAISLPTQTDFLSPEGTIPLAKNIIKALKKDSSLAHSVSFESELWKEEHGIFAHTPFIHHYFPKARLLPVALKPCATNEDFIAFKNFATFLANNLPQDALIVASVDFSHYQIPRMTELHDKVSLNTIANMESPRDLEVDSPESLFTLMEFCTLRKKTVPILLHRTCTYDKIPDENIESTSHQYWTFYSEKDTEFIEAFYKEVLPLSSQRAEKHVYGSKKNQTVLIAGSGDMGTEFRTAWHWDRYQTATNKGDILLRDLAGKEARFLSGFDAYIFDVPPGNTFSIEKHKTPLFIQSESSLLSLSAKKTNNDYAISILVIIREEDSEESTLKDYALKELSLFDAVIIRDNIGKSDAYAYFMGTDGTPVTINLGIIKSADGSPVKGNILVLNWQDGLLSYECFDYESESGLVPAIHQFPAED